MIMETKVQMRKKQQQLKLNVQSVIFLVELRSLFLQWKLEKFWARTDWFSVGHYSDPILREKEIEETKSDLLCGRNDLIKLVPKKSIED